MITLTGCQSENEPVVWPGLCERYSCLFVYAESVPSVFSCLLQVNNVEESRSVQDAPTLLVSEKGAGLLNASANSVISYPPAKVDSSSYNEDTFDNNEWVTLYSQAPVQLRVYNSTQKSEKAFVSELFLKVTVKQKLECLYPL